MSHAHRIILIRISAYVTKYINSWLCVIKNKWNFKELRSFFLQKIAIKETTACILSTNTSSSTRTFEMKWNETKRNETKCNAMCLFIQMCCISLFSYWFPTVFACVLNVADWLTIGSTQVHHGRFHFKNTKINYIRQCTGVSMAQGSFVRVRCTYCQWILIKMMESNENRKSKNNTTTTFKRITLNFKVKHSKCEMSYPSSGK